MLKRFQAAVGRLNKLIDRIESRIDKIKTEDPSKDLTNVTNQIDTAKTKLAATQTKIDTLKTDLDSILASDTPKEAFRSLVKKVVEIKKDLNSVHRILVHVIGDIKGLRVGEK